MKPSIINNFKSRLSGRSSSNYHILKRLRGFDAEIVKFDDNQTTAHLQNAKAVNIDDLTVKVNDAVSLYNSHLNIKQL